MGVSAAGVGAGTGETGRLNVATRVVSFGYKHGETPEETGGDLVIDVRQLFKRNPYRRHDLRYLRGTDPAVAEDIEKTPGFAQSFETLARLVSNAKGTVYLGCTGGHHRSVYLAERVGKLLGVPVSHRDIGKK